MDNKKKVVKCNECWREFEIDFPYHTDDIVELLDEKDQQISDLEAKLAECEEEHGLLIDQFEEETEKLRKQIKQESDARKRFVEEVKELKQQLAISEKALELACERVKYFEEMQDKEMGFYEFFGYDSDYDLKAIIEQYKQQAKEMLENE